jgi:pimeloyl-ACP methyl ester carboxylesterase
MPSATIRGVRIDFEIIGEGGPWFVLTPGGRSGLEVVRPLAEKIAAGGYRVLVHDRLNCGASDVVVAKEASEDAMGADHLAELMTQLGAAPAIAVAMGGGNRTSFFLALRHPELLRGVVVCWPSGGRRAAEALADMYYGEFATAARNGGMAAVCETEYYRDRIARNPRNRERLLAMAADDFIGAMEGWAQGFRESADWPTVALTEDQLRAIDMPVCVLAGLIDDPIHGRDTSEAVAHVLPRAEIRYLPEERRPADADRGWLAAALKRRAEQPELLGEILRFAAQAPTPQTTLSGR